MRSTSARPTKKPSRLPHPLPSPARPAPSSGVLRKLALCAAAVALLPLTASAGAEGDDVADATKPPAALAEVVTGLQAHYDDVKDISADFTLENVVKSIGRRETAKGRVVIARPGRMRWQYAEPEAQVLALDGETFRMYVPSENQLTIAPASPGEGGSGLPPTAFDFLLGTGRLDASFRPEPLDEAEPGERGLRLRPRDDASFEWLDLWVGAEDFVLRRSRVVDLFGNVTVVRFADVRENAGTPPDAFDVSVPDGTDTIDLRPTR